MGEMLSELRNVINEPVTALMTDTQGIQWLNDGGREVARRTECLEDKRSFSSIAYQQHYSHGTYWLRMKDMSFDNRNTVWPMDARTWDMETRQSYDNTSNRPQYIRDWEEKYEIWPRLNASADASTLGSTIATAATSLTIADGTGFDRMGRFTLESEIIEYTNKTGTATDAVLEGLVRGAEGTTDASHATAVAITRRDFIEEFYCLPQTYTSADATSMPQDSLNAVYLWGQYKFHSKNKEPQIVAQYKGMFEDECKRLKVDLRKKQKKINKTLKAGDRYIGRL